MGIEREPERRTPDEESLRKAHAVVERLRAEFREWLQEDLQVARQALAGARGAPPDDLQAYLQVRRAAHNFTGLGGSFGYDLVTEIGASLSALLRAAERVSAAVTESAAAHVAAIARVVDDGLQGDGGEPGRVLLAELRRQVDLAAASDGAGRA